VIGFDDNLYAQWSRPALTTVHQDVEKRGSVAAQTLLEILSGNPPAERRIEMKSELIIRDTVCKIG
jgi:DNA-binding LacI/PurR family transcriptional regulator